MLLINIREIDEKKEKKINFFLATTVKTAGLYKHYSLVFDFSL